MEWDAQKFADMITDCVKVTVSVVNYNPAKPPAWHLINFGEGVHTKHRYVGSEVRERFECLPWEYKSIVNFVTQKGDLELFSNLNNLMLMLL